jgi:hypothetical protein
MTRRAGGLTADRTLEPATGAPATTAAAATTDGHRPSGLGRNPRLTACGRFFWTKLTPWVIGPLLLAAAAARVVVGRWSWADLVVVAVILGLEPLTEWLIHVYILHFRPRTVGGRRLDLHAARKHREHHRDPADVDTAFVPIPDLVTLVGFAVGLAWLLAPDTPTFLTAVVTSLAMLFTYEWTHFLIHTSYKPRHGYYRYVWRAHRLHHYKNERYWMGVTIHLADHVLGTFPDKSEVENSPTARTLGVEAP